ncbi:MAG: protease modulator HflC [Eubacteriales bacterium]|nr:protease modulator HflC [Candidatus Flemingibacterium sp.]
MKKIIITAAIIVVLLITLSGAFYTVAENEYAYTLRFSEIVNVTNEAGLHFKLPFIDEVRRFPDTTLIYDIPPSEVLTSDKKNMTVDSYIIWEISDPKTFYRTLGTTNEAEARLNAVTYNSLKNLMGKLEQNDIINMDDASERNDIYAGITTEVAEICSTYGINVLDVRIKRFDLPGNNEQAVYERMISDRSQIAEKYTADGNYEASIIRNDVDKQVNIIVSNAEAEAARLEAEGEQEYMRLLAEAYNTADKKDFYEFTRALDALKASLTGNDKTVIIDRDSRLGQILMNPESVK